MNRRRFSKKLGLGTASLVLAPSVVGCLATVPSKRFGIILNTVKDAMAHDFEATLRALKEMGYRYVEGGFYGDSLKSYAKTLKGIGLKGIGHGSSMGELKKDFARYVEIAETLEHQYIICYYPWMVGNDQIDEKRTFETVERLNGLGKRIKDRGFQFCWHPHNFEFKTLKDGRRPFDIIMDNTDPELVQLQLDTYWFKKGGGSVIEYINAYKRRIPLFHLKDMARDGSISCPGQGIMPIQKILASNAAADSMWIVEVENIPNGLTCAGEAIDFLKH
ncbi:sugar phosphate isomerase/epimerase family protein [Ulvibacterium marinum]|nr:sugar phosphate isomerase/epimerase [Ulvibacterium marinum]